MPAKSLVRRIVSQWRPNCGGCVTVRLEIAQCCRELLGPRRKVVTVATIGGGPSPSGVCASAVLTADWGKFSMAFDKKFLLATTFIAGLAMAVPLLAMAQ